MPLRLTGGPEEAAAQLIAHLQCKGILDKIGILLSGIAILLDGHASTIFLMDFSFTSSLTSRLLHQ